MFWVCVTLALLTFAVYAPSLTHEFLTYDDQQYVTENPRVRAGLTGPGVIWAFTSFYAGNWHPVTWLSHMLDCQLYGLHPAGHHLMNVLLHVANTLLLFQVMRLMTGAFWRSAMVAALFAWHPLHVESVAWIAERKDMLSAFFWMLTLWAYVAYGLRKSTGQMKRPSAGVRSSPYYLLALLFFSLGLMSKPMVVTLPFVMLLLDYWPLRRLRFNREPSGATSLASVISEKIPFVILSAIGCYLTVLAQGQSHSIVSAVALSLGRRLGHALVSYSHYLSATLVPRHLATHYPYPPAESALEIVGAAVLLLLISVVALRLARLRPYLLVGWLWFLGTLVPVVGLIQVGDQAWADRYAYLPLIGLFIALVWGASDLLSHCLSLAKEQQGGAGSQRQASRARLLENGPTSAALDPQARQPLLVGTLQYGVPVLLGVGLLTGTTLQLRYWKDTRTLFSHAVAVTKDNARALAVLGSLLAAENNIPAAMDLYRRALSIKPDDPEAHFFMGAALAEQGKFDEAISEYNRALWFKPLQEKTHIFTGIALAKGKKYGEAAAQYEAALALNPECATAHNNLGRLFHTQGRLDEAIAQYEAALRTDPTLTQAHNNVGVLLLQKGRVTEGAAHLAEAVRLNPADTESRYNLALALNQEQQWQKAADLFAQLEQTRGQDADLHNQFALALARLGKTRDAMSHYAQALLLRQDFPAALDGLAWILSTDPRPEFRNGNEAIQMAERACELTGRQDPGMLATLAAAYAETGRFDKAAEVAMQAQALAGGGTRQALLTNRCQIVMEAIKAGKPFREAR